MTLLIDKYSAVKVLSNITICIWGFLIGANFYFVVAMIILLDMIISCIRKIENYAFLFAFGIAFFIFLMGRDFLENFFRYKVELHYSTEINNHAYICMILALVSIWGAYWLFSEKIKIKFNQHVNRSSQQISSRYIDYIQQISKLFFYTTIPFAIASRLAIVRFVGNNSYTEYYTDYSELLVGNTALYIVSKIELAMPVALCIFLATYPTKKDSKKILIVYFIYLLISLGAGSRGPFVLGILLLLVFFVTMQGIRPEEKWFSRRYLLVLLLLVPVAAVSGYMYNLARFGISNESTSLLDAFTGFFYDQGVTVTVIKRAYQFADQIPEQGLYTLEFVHSGIIARLLGIPVYNGNSINHAMHGGSFTHAIGYVIMGQGYLAGRGTGSSYIAELYHDFGYIGVVIGSFIYGVIFSKLTEKDSQSVLSRAIVFALMTQFLWAPRGGFSAFLSYLLAPSTIFVFIVTFGMAKMLDKYK